MKYWHWNLVIACLLLALLSIGCASTNRSAARTATSTLASSAELYEASMSAFAQLYREGKVGEDDKARVIKYAEKFWVAYHAAVMALDFYRNEPGDLTSVYTSMAVLSETMAEFLKCINEIQEGWPE